MAAGHCVRLAPSIGAPNTTLFGSPIDGFVKVSYPNPELDRWIATQLGKQRGIVFDNRASNCKPKTVLNNPVGLKIVGLLISEPGLI